jgi:hypothetical protein
MPTEDTNDFTMFYTATMVNDVIVDEFISAGTELQGFLEGKVTALDLSNTKVNIDMPEELETDNIKLNDNIMSQATRMNTVSIVGAFLLSQVAIM